MVHNLVEEIDCERQGPWARTHIGHDPLFEYSPHILRADSIIHYESYILTDMFTHSFHKHLFNTCDATPTRWNTVKAETYL